MAVQDSQISEGSAATSIDGEKTHVVDIQAEVAPESFTTEEEKQAFLATFTAEDDKAIMRKVDRKFLLLIGLMYMVKNVSYVRQNQRFYHLMHIIVDRLFERCIRQGASSRSSNKCHDAAWYDFRSV